MMTKTSDTLGTVNSTEEPAGVEGCGAVHEMPAEPVGRTERPAGPCASAPAPAVGVIPVGGEPPRQPRAEGDGGQTVLPELPVQGAAEGRRAGGKRRDKNGNTRPALRNPDGFYKYKNRLEELRVFRCETMRHLRRRAEITVWLAIHGCQHDGAAQISQRRISELAGIKNKRHVVEVIKGLRRKGLLEVLAQGRYRPNGAEEHGLSSVYRVYPRPESRLLNSAAVSQTGPGAGGDVSGVCADLQKAKITKPKKPNKPR
jgi:hypothetical protein